MSNTPETDFHCWTDNSEELLIAVCHADFCRKLERERNEARKLADEFHKDQTRLLMERDEAREKAGRYRLEANALMMQRDEAREKIERQAERIRKLECATNHAGGLNK